jgi:hypothetical protein
VCICVFVLAIKVYCSKYFYNVWQWNDFCWKCGWSDETTYDVNMNQIGNLLDVESVHTCDVATTCQIMTMFNLEL